MPAQKDKTSTTARLEVLNGPAAAAIEPRKNKYKKLRKLHTDNTNACH